MRIAKFGLVILALSGQVYAATPDTVYLKTPLGVLPELRRDKVTVTVDDFISYFPGGKWLQDKRYKEMWLYKTTFKQANGKTNKYDFYFYKSPYGVSVEQIKIDGKNLPFINIESHIKQICLELPKIKEYYATLRARLFGEYIYESGSSSKKIMIKPINNNKALIDITTEYKGSEVCNISNKEVEITTPETIFNNFDHELLFEDKENDCFIRILAHPSLGKATALDVKTKGKCETYCNINAVPTKYNRKEEFLPSNNFPNQYYIDVKFKRESEERSAEIERNKWK